MQEVNEAYDEITKMRKNKSKGGESGPYGSGAGVYADIRRLINNRRFAEAERELVKISQYDRNAEWHYLTSVLLMQRGRINDAMRELEIACNMDPSNFEYQKAKEMFNTNAGGYQNTYYGSANGNAAYRRSDVDRACDCCSNLICLDCLCECLGGDLIACC
jgi:tetratricopeptide (TPR) repeat protein